MKDITIENNVEKLNDYWREHECRDLSIKDICHFRNRCIISLGDYVVLCDGVSDYDSTVSTFPTRLFEQSLVWSEGRARLKLTTYTGVCNICCGKIRLYDHASKTMLIE